jgi:hypothetical protein
MGFAAGEERVGGGGAFGFVEDGGGGGMVGAGLGQEGPFLGERVEAHLG